MNVIVISKNESVIYGGKIYKLDDTFEADNEIAASLIERGYVAEAIAPVPVEGEVEELAPSDEAELQTGYLDKNQLEEMSYPDLKRLAAQMGLDATGKKVDLIERIAGEEVTADSESEAELPNTAMPE